MRLSTFVRAPSAALPQLPRIDAITLTTFFQTGIPAGIAHHDLGDVRLQQVILFLGNTERGLRQV
jgi:hypothetical protein